jgi:DNA mismatch repair protein MutS
MTERRFRPAPASTTGSGRATSPCRWSSASSCARLKASASTGHPAAAIAAGAVLHYVRTTQKNDALHLDSLKFQEHSTALSSTRSPCAISNSSSRYFRARHARHALPHARRMPDAHGQAPAARHHPAPALRCRSHRTRYEAVAEAHGDLLKREEVRRAFNGILDLERLLARLSLDSPARATFAPRRQPGRLPALKLALNAMNAALARSIAARLDPLDDRHRWSKPR